MSPTDDNECPFMGEFAQRFHHIEEDVRDIRNALLGNGRPGLMDRVSKNEGQIKVVYGVLGALGVGVITLVVRLVDKLF